MNIVLLFIISLVILISLALLVWCIIWSVKEFKEAYKYDKEMTERLRKAKPLTGTAKEVFRGTYLAR